MWRLARCNDLIRLKACHQDCWYEGDQAWGLKQCGTLFVVDRLLEMKKQTKTLRVLEAGAGHNTFFNDWCFRQGIEYWLIDTASFYPPDIFRAAKEKRTRTNFVDGLLGHGIQDLSNEYFDAVFSISVIEHVPDKELLDFWREMYRILKKNGRAIHSLDTCPSDGKEKINFEACAESLFPGNDLEKDVTFFADTLFEPLSIQYIYYSGKERDMWGKNVTNVHEQYGTVLIDIEK
ncbi:MAG: class I SAM-dependent methyltransferase [Desulfovibrio sp.]|jgi:SAM-dependent methyltransferase|nr:class I SAM-dependent methyltransferase [Desulfovibrio sp.]